MKVVQFLPILSQEVFNLLPLQRDRSASAPGVQNPRHGQGNGHGLEHFIEQGHVLQVRLTISSNIGQWRSILTVTDGLHRTPQSGLLSGSGVRMPTLLQTLPSPASSSISEAAVLAREGEVRILASFHTLRGGRCLRRPSPQLRRCHVLPLQDQSLRPCSGATR